MIEEQKHFMAQLLTEIDGIENEKQAAVAIEDYDKAKECKGKIQALHLKVRSIREELAKSASPSTSSLHNSTPSARSGKAEGARAAGSSCGSACGASSPVSEKRRPQKS